MAKTSFNSGSGVTKIEINNTDTPYTITSAVVGADVDRKIQVLADSSSAAITIILPTIDEEGFDIEVKDSGGSAGTNNIFVKPSATAKVDSGTTDGTTEDKLVDAGQNFDVTVDVGDLIFNTTNNTFTTVSAVDSASTLSLNDDIMESGQGYEIYDVDIDDKATSIIASDDASYTFSSDSTASSWGIKQVYLKSIVPNIDPVSELFEKELTQVSNGETGPCMGLFQDSASPAQFDLPGFFAVKGRNDAGDKLEYTRISSFIDAATAGTEVGVMMFQTADGAGADFDDDGGIAMGLRATSAGTTVYLGDGWTGGSNKSVTVTTSGGTLQLGNTAAEIVKIKGRLVEDDNTLYTTGGAITVTDALAKFDSNVTGMAMSLADGVDNQVIKLLYVDETAAGDTVVITPANLYEGSTITMADVGDFVMLLFTAGNWWVMMDYGTITIA